MHPQIHTNLKSIMLSLSHGRGFPLLLPKLSLSLDRQIKSSDLIQDPEIQCPFSPCIRVQHWAQARPQELINLYAIPSLLPCPALLCSPHNATEREEKERKATRCNPTPLMSSLLLSGSIVEQLKQTVVCANKGSQRSRGEEKKQEYQLVDRFCSPSSTLTSHYPLARRAGKFCRSESSRRSGSLSSRITSNISGSRSAAMGCKS